MVNKFEVPNTIMIATEILKPHPRSKEFFSDLEGESYEILKLSIEKYGILRPIVIAPDLTIVVGHQRWRAAKELGLETVPVVIDAALNDETAKIRALFDNNWRREDTPENQRKALAAYVEMFGLKHGGDRRSKNWRSNPKNKREDEPRA